MPKNELLGLETMNGWCCRQKAEQIYDTIIDLSNQFRQPLACVEIGVFAGRSLLAAAIALRDSAHGGFILGIDPYTVEAAVEGKPTVGPEGDDRAWWSRVDFAAVERECQNAIDVKRLTMHCSLLKCKAEACHHAIGGLHYIHFDDSHDPLPGCRNVRDWLPKLLPGGVAILDDVNWPQVQKARKLIQDELELVCIGKFEQNEWEVYRRN